MPNVAVLDHHSLKGQLCSLGIQFYFQPGDNQIRRWKIIIIHTLRNVVSNVGKFNMWNEHGPLIEFQSSTKQYGGRFPRLELNTEDFSIFSI